jgi:hypothetical protein
MGHSSSLEEDTGPADLWQRRLRRQQASPRKENHAAEHERHDLLGHVTDFTLTNVHDHHNDRGADGGDARHEEHERRGDLEHTGS